MRDRLGYLAVIALCSVVEFIARKCREWAEEKLTAPEPEDEE